MPEVVVVGAGGFGRETLDVIEAHNASAAAGEILEVLGVVDDAPSAINLERIASRGCRILGTLREVIAAGTPRHYVLGVGDPRVKRRLARTLDAAGWLPARAVHPNASIGSCVQIGPGAVICGGVQLSTNTVLGRHVHLNPNVTIGHDAVLEDFVSVNPGAIVSGEVVLAEAVLVGAGAVILQGLRVGPASIVGASACVVRDVEPSITVVGVPARAFGHNAELSR